MTIHEADAVGKPWLEIATVLVHVYKILLIAGCGESFFEAHGAPNVTHAMVSAFFLDRCCGPQSICRAFGRPSWIMWDRQTLRVCS